VSHRPGAMIRARHVGSTRPARTVAWGNAAGENFFRHSGARPGWAASTRHVRAGLHVHLVELRTIPWPVSGVSSPGRSPARIAGRGQRRRTMSDPMRHRNVTPLYGAGVPANAGTDGVTLDTVAPEQSPTAGSVGAVPTVEADAQDSRVLEQQLIEQGGWHELIELLLNRSERVQGAERVETLRQVAAIFEGGSAIRRALSRPWTRLTAKTPRTRRSSMISCGSQPHWDAWTTWRLPPGARSRRCLDTKRRSSSSRRWPAGRSAGTSWRSCFHSTWP
jgi:hypothetical protein